MARRLCSSTTTDVVYLHTVWCASSVRRTMSLDLDRNIAFAREYIVGVSFVLSHFCADQCAAVYGGFVVFSSRHPPLRINDCALWLYGEIPD